MEPGDRVEEALSARAAGITRFRLVAVCALLVGLAFVQDPGLLTSDTKFDLVESPGRFLARALNLWDPKGDLGQLQNQAYGYLWPMGPFHLLGHLVGLPGWVVQRSWLALVLCVAFLGTAKLSRALGVRSDLACIVAGLAFALSPRMLTTVGPISIEAWPGALAPWVLLPLVLGSTRGSPRRAAALSALAVAMVGGVNAAATFAVLPMGIIWLLTRTSGPRRRSLMLWWPMFTLLGTLWWLVPLFLMGAYSPPFLQYIETTSVTTFPTDLFDTLRGTSNWVPYISAASRAGNDLLVQGFLPFASGVVLLVGFAGLLDRRHPHRLFLTLSLLAGVLMVTAGHTGPVTGWFSGDVRALLDGSLAPLRNVHKFDPIVRLPLVLGLALVLDGVRRAPASSRESSLEASLQRFNRGSLVAMTLVAVAAAATPVFATRIAPADPVLAIPGYWQQTANWLDARKGDGASLLVPGSAFADYVWGSPRDEPLQYLSTAAWTVRNQIPLTPTGNIRMLTEIEKRFSQGEGSAGLTDYLRRAGLRYLVVRNDLRPDNDVPDPVLTHQTLAHSPGIVRVKTFGPQVGGGAHLTKGGVRTVINGGWQALHPAVEIYQVTGASRSGSVTASPVTVAGGPEDLIDLANLGVIGGGASVLANDVPQRRRSGPLARGPLVLTDGLRTREAGFARIHDLYSSMITPGDVRRSGNPNRDYLEPGQDAWSSRERLEGARLISASSSGSDANALGGSRRGQLPYAAVDGSSDSQWVSDPGQVGRPWWGIRLERATRVDSVVLTGGASAVASQAVRVVTDRGRSRSVDLGPGESARLRLGGDAIRWLRVEAHGDSRDSRLALAEVTIPGVQVVRRVVLPTLPRSWGDPDSIVLRTDLDAREGCATVGGSVRCVPGQQRASEEPKGMARALTLGSASRYVPELRVRARPGPALDDLLLLDQPVGVTASSTAVPDPRASALAAIDDDRGTTWIADAADPRPSLSLSWLTSRRVTGIAISGSKDVAARLPTDVTLVWPGGTRKVNLDSRGRGTFPAITTDQLQIRVDRAETVRSLGFDAQGSDVGVGIGELRLSDVPSLPVIPSTQRIERPCGSGPVLNLQGRTYPTAVRASTAELLAGDEVPATVCTKSGTGRLAPSPGRTELAFRAGENDLSLTSSTAFDPVSLVLDRPRASPPPSAVADADAQSIGSSRLVLHPPQTADAVVSLPQNENPGWTASQGGHRLDPLTVDGWQQAWLVPRGDEGGSADSVTARFAPNALYRLGLGSGLLALLGLVVCVALLLRRPGRRDAQSLSSRRGSTVALGLLTLAAVGFVAGWQGLLIAAVVLIGTAYLQDRRPDVAPWALSAPCLVVGLAFFAQPWANPGDWAGSHHWTGYLMLVPLVAVLGSVNTERPRSLSRMAGPSTKR